MRKSPFGWRMDAGPSELSPFRPITALAGNDTILIASVFSGDTGTEFHVRTNGVWSQAPDAPSFITTLSTMSGQTFLALGAGGGEVYKYDGAWAKLPQGTWTTPRAIWGDPGNLYVAHSTGLQHFDGLAWTEIAPAFPILDFVGVGGTPTGVYAVTKSNVYQVSGGTLTAIAGVPTPAAPCGSQAASYQSILAAGSTLIVTDTCAGSGVQRLWLRQNAGWSLLPTPPASGPSTNLRLMPDGTLTLTKGANEFDTGMYVLTAGAWSLIPIEVHEPAKGFVQVVGGNPLYIQAHPHIGQTWNLVRKVGSAFQQAPGIPASVAAAPKHLVWRAPDGVIFVASTDSAGTNTELHRFDGTTWTLDAVQPLDPAALKGRTSSDVFLLDRQGAFWRWNGAAWSAGPKAPLGINEQILGAAAAGTNRIVAGQTPNKLLEFDGVGWANTGTTTGQCCTQLGDTNPQAVIQVNTSTLAVRDQAGWTTVSMTIPSMQLLDTFAGPSVSQLYGRLSTNYVAPWILGTLNSSHVWTAVASDNQVLQPGEGISLWTDGATAAMASKLGGFLVAMQYIGGEAVTTCTLGP